MQPGNDPYYVWPPHTHNMRTACQADYVTPNGLPAEVGLQAALARRGAGAVSVVPIVRTDWINVAKVS